MKPEDFFQEDVGAAVMQAIQELEEGRPSEALSFINKGIRKIRERDKDHLSSLGLAELAYCYYWKGLIYYNNKKFRKSKKCLNFYQELYKRVNPEETEELGTSWLLLYPHSFGYLGKMAENGGKRKKARFYYLKAVEALRELYNRCDASPKVGEVFLDALRNLMDFCLEKVYWYEFPEYAEEFLKVYDAEGLPQNNPEIAQIYAFMANCYTYMGQQKEARKWSNKALLASRDAQNANTKSDDNSFRPIETKILSYINLGQTEKFAGNYKAALKYYQEVADIIAEALEDEGLDAYLRAQFELTDLMLACSKCEVLGLMGDYKAERRILQRIRRRVSNCLELASGHEDLMETAKMIIFMYTKYYIEVLCGYGEFEGAIKLLEYFINHLRSEFKSQSFNPTFQALLLIHLQELRIDVSLRYSEDLTNRENLSEVYDFIKENLKCLEDFDEMFPDELDEKKLRELKRRCARLRGML